MLADSTRAVEKGHYPAEALKYRMAVKGLMQSDPHDARILKAFALGLAVATRGMDHLRNRVTLEINARINDDPAFKERLYGGAGQRRAEQLRGQGTRGPRSARTCTRSAIRSACAASRRSCSTARRCPGSSSSRRRSPTSPASRSPTTISQQIGLNIMGVERLINHRLGVRRKDDTLPDRWFDEPITVGPTRARRSIAPSSTRCCRGSTPSRSSMPKARPIKEWRQQLEAVIG